MYGMFNHKKLLLSQISLTFFQQNLEVRRLALQKTITNNQQRLNELENEKLSLEHVLDRTSKLYRQTLLERRQMTDTWSAAVETLNARNITIRETMEVKIFFLHFKRFLQELA